MQKDSSIAIQKNPPFDSGITALNNLMQVYWDQFQAFAVAEQLGLPEPVLETPPLPNYLIYRI